MRFLRPLIILCVLAATTAIAACGTQSPPAPAESTFTGNCSENGPGTRHVTFGPAKLEGAILGKGSTGMVLAHQNGGSACQWLPNALEFVAQGYRVLIFNFSGFGGSPSGSPSRQSDVEEAIKALRADGVRKTVLIGASMGGTAVLAAAGAVTPPVDAVVALSAPQVFGGADAGSAAPKLTMPVFYAAGANENVYALGAQLMHDSSKASPDAQLVLASGSAAHGVALVQPNSGEKVVSDGMAAFLKKWAPPAS
jgi:pimeloyl-ACP methyl ester carboxylesterase